MGTFNWECVWRINTNKVLGTAEATVGDKKEEEEEEEEDEK